MKKLYFGRDEKDVIRIEPGGMSYRTASSAVVMRPTFLRCARCATGEWPVTVEGFFVAEQVMVASLRIGLDEQLTAPIPLSVLCASERSIGALALDTILPNEPVYIKLVSTAKERIECVLWLEGDEVVLTRPTRSLPVAECVVCRLTNRCLEFVEERAGGESIVGRMAAYESGVIAGLVALGGEFIKKPLVCEEHQKRLHVAAASMSQEK